MEELVCELRLFLDLLDREYLSSGVREKKMLISNILHRVLNANGQNLNTTFTQPHGQTYNHHITFTHDLSPLISNILHRVPNAKGQNHNLHTPFVQFNHIIITQPQFS